MAKSCPFCGFDDSEVQVTGARPLRFYYIYCNCCECRGPSSPNEKRAWEAWDKQVNGVATCPECGEEV